MKEFIGWSVRLYCHLKYDFARSMASSAVLKGFACTGKREHFGYHRL
jgi:hypothetical protein